MSTEPLCQDRDFFAWRQLDVDTLLRGISRCISRSCAFAIFPVFHIFIFIFQYILNCLHSLARVHARNIISYPKIGNKSILWQFCNPTPDNDKA